jgi:ParB family chromosome partitioning protein
MTETATLPPQRRLGRGLSALLGGGAPAYAETEQELHSELREIPVTQITRNPFQPRKHFDPESLGELASSIREHGVLQPIIVREADGAFQLIAGERRWQAAQKAGLVRIPCRVVDVIDKTACEFALEENLKRKDLNDLEKAQAFRDYIDQFECSIEELSRQLSMSRSSVSNMLRLLELPDPVKNALHNGKITAGHARALLPVSEADQLELCSRIQAEQLSVRLTEAAVKKLLGRDVPPASQEQPSQATTPAQDSDRPEQEPAGAPQAVQQESDSQPEHQSHEQPAAEQSHDQQQPDQSCHGEVNRETIPITEGERFRTPHVESLESQLRDLLGVPVQIQLNSRDCGQIIVSFQNNDEFERILGTLRRNAA